MSNITDPYQILGVSPNATDDEVKKAYRELSRKYHPDANAGNPLSDLAEEKFKQVQEAYSQIMDMRNGKTSYNGYNQGTQGYSQGTQGIIRITTGRDISNMVRVMAEVLMETTLTTVLQEISVVTFGVLIRFVNVWEEIFAVAFKIKTGGMVRYHYGIYGDITDSIRHYRDKLTFSSCGGFIFSRMR